MPFRFRFWSYRRRLGKRWSSLHRLVYLVALLVILHFVWLVKADLLEPLVYAAILAVLLALRWEPLQQRVRHLVQQRIALTGSHCG